MTKTTRYYVHKPNYWPIIGALGLFLMMAGFANWLHSNWFGPYLAFVGVGVIIIMIVGWASELFYEKIRQTNRVQVNESYRWGMVWFILSEVLFFATFFFALFYARYISVPTLGGETYYPETHNLLWPHFKAMW